MDNQDPFTQALIALFAGQNPQQAGPLLDQAGLKPPMGLGGPGPGVGGMMPGASPVQPDASMMEGQPTPSTMPPSTGWDATVTPTPSGLGGPPPPAAAPAQSSPDATNKQMQALAALQGIKAPAPIQPSVHGGVTGGVKEPTAKMGVSQGQTPALSHLLQMLLNRSNPTVAPSLGALLPGR